MKLDCQLTTAFPHQAFNRNGATFKETEHNQLETSRFGEILSYGLKTFAHDSVNVHCILAKPSVCLVARSYSSVTSLRLCSTPQSSFSISKDGNNLQKAHFTLMPSFRTRSSPDHCPRHSKIGDWNRVNTRRLTDNDYGLAPRQGSRPLTWFNRHGTHDQTMRTGHLRSRSFRPGGLLRRHGIEDHLGITEFIGSFVVAKLGSEPTEFVTGDW